MNIVVTGSLGYDYIMDFSGKFADRIKPDNIHKISLSPLVDTLKKQFGGTAGNIAYSLKLLGLEPMIQSSLGNDALPYTEFLIKHHMNTAYISVQKKVVSGTYFVVTDQEDSQIGAFYKGALAYNNMLSLKKIREPFSFVMIAPNEKKAMIQYVKECMYLKKPYLYDPAFQIGDFSKSELLEGITHAAIVIGNDYEIDLLLDKLGISKKKLISMTSILVTTLGGKGSRIETKTETIHVKPAKVKNTSDPTGAGDAYRGGFLAGFLRGYDLRTCGQMGSVSAAYTVEQYGTMTHSYTKKQFIERYMKNFHAALVL